MWIHAARTRLSGSDAESDGLSLLNQLGGEGAQTARPQTVRREHEMRSATQLSDSEGGRNLTPRQLDAYGARQTSPEATGTTPSNIPSHLWTISKDRSTPKPPRAKKNLGQTYGNANAKPPTGDPPAGPRGRRARGHGHGPSVVGGRCTVVVGWCVRPCVSGVGCSVSSSVGRGNASAWSPGAMSSGGSVVPGLPALRLTWCDCHTVGALEYMSCISCFLVLLSGCPCLT